MNNSKEFQSCADRLKAIADPDRLRIVLCLFEGEKSVGEIAEHLKEELVKVSHHLGVLRHAQIVLTERQGRYIIYRLDPNIALRSEGGGPSRWIEFGCCRLELADAGR